jgi:hypothetical protein
MRPQAILAKGLSTAIALALVAAPARAEEEAASPKPPGLPSGLDWTFNFGATIGSFGFANSFYSNPKPEQPSGDLSDNWFEGSLTGGLSAVYKTASSAEVYGKVSAVGERTYSSGPTGIADDANSFEVEDLYLGWRSGKSIGDTENVLDFTVGRTRYRLGHGLLVWDGSSEGGSRGGYWTNARQAFDLAAIARFKPGANTLEAFYLERDDLPEGGSNSELWGVNYEYAFGEDTTLGATYMKWSANPNEAPQRDGLDVYNLRAFTAPFPGLKALSFEAEYAKEDNGALLDSEAWNALVGYQFESRWQPKLSYRYAVFEGDNPATAANEAFDGLFTGFYDWGTWWQGEIAGEYFVSNSNLVSHQLRLHMKPNDAISTGLIFYDFKLDQRASFDPLVTSDDIGLELDWYMDWSVNDNFILSFVAAAADPGDAIKQSTGRTDTFWYGMVFASYSF